MGWILKNKSRKQSIEQLRSRIYNIREDEGDIIDQAIEKKLLKMQKRKAWAKLILQYVLVVAVVYFVFNFIIGIAVVKHNSMYPNVKEGDVIIFNRLSEITSGDIVVLYANQEQKYIKRVVAIAGDEVDINDTGILSINGTEMEEDYVFTPTYPKNSELTFPLRIEKNEVFVLGDNRVVSKDSREIGTINNNDIKGKMIMIFRFGQ